MNVFKRAILYITRKKVKSIILLLILFSVSISSLIGVSIKKAAIIAKNESKQHLANSFQIKGKTEDKSINQVAPTKETITMFEDENMNLMYIEGHENTKAHSEFINKNLELIEGRHIEKGDKNKVLIHEALAELNNLKIGDKIEAKDSYELEIVGVFKTNNTERVGIKSELIENLIISDNNTFKELYGYNDENVGNIIEDVKKLSLNWDDYDLITGEKKSQALLKGFYNLDRLINIILVGGIIIGIVVISLVLAFWIQGRIKETGILLSIGISKVEIIAQYIIELLIISVIAFGMAYIPGKAVTNEVKNVLIEQANNEASEELNENLSETNNRIDNIDIKVEFKELIYVYIIETGIIIEAVVISSLPITTLKSKAILSKMS